MISLSRAIFYLFHSRRQFFDSCVKNLGFLFPDKLYLSLRYRVQMGHWIDWKSPKSFTEKMQWLKLYGSKLEYTKMVDKYAVKSYVGLCIGKEYLIPTIGVWNCVDDIDWESLPDQFVLKTTHGGGGCGVVVCSDLKKFDKKKAIEKLSFSMKSVAGKEYREHPYYNVPKMIIAEKYLVEDNAVGDNREDLTDYKFYCFNGEPIYCQVIRDRHSNESIDFYDMKWNLMPFIGINPSISNSNNHIAKNGLHPVPCPRKLNEMIKICKKLAKTIPFVRIDLYYNNNNVYFGEITFYPAGGIGVFSPIEWDKKLGDLIKLQ